METVGGGILIVVAAVLWGAVLVPGIFKRRETRAVEKQAARLQKTIKQLQATAESDAKAALIAQARDALTREKVLALEQKTRAAKRAAQIAEARARYQAEQLRARQIERAQLAERRKARLQGSLARRFRSIAALIVVVGLLATLTGFGLALAGQGAAVLVTSLLATVIGFAALVLLAPGRIKVPAVTEFAAPRRQNAPVQLPAPELERSAAAADASAVAAAAEFQAAQAQRKAELDTARARARARQQRLQALVAAQARQQQTGTILLRPERVSQRPKQTAQGASQRPASQSQPVARQQAAAPSRVAAPAPLRELGIYDDVTVQSVNLDSAMRRRRAAH